MSGVSERDRIARGQQAEALLRAPILQQAVDELQRRSYDLFLAAAEDQYGDLSRANAVRMVKGAEALLDILKGWVVEARQLVGADEESEHV